MNFITDLKVRGDLSRERKLILHYYNFSYFARFQGTRDQDKRDFWGISSSSPAQQPRWFSVCIWLCLWPGSHPAEDTRHFCSMRSCALKLSPVRKPFLCNAKNSCSAAAQGQLPPFILRAAFPCPCSICPCKLLVPRGWLNHRPCWPGMQEVGGQRSLLWVQLRSKSVVWLPAASCAGGCCFPRQV